MFGETSNRLRVTLCLTLCSMTMLTNDGVDIPHSIPRARVASQVMARNKQFVNDLERRST